MQTSFSVENLHPITKVLLEKRGIVTPETIEKFLFPSYERDIGNPFDILGMDRAATRVTEAMQKGEKIAVYSDYDCDGVPGGVLLRTFFNEIGYPVEMYIPHRHNEGYGIHVHAVDALKAKGVTLIITVDLAITNIEEIAYAKSQGIDFIVTDHHLPVHKDDAIGFEGKGVVSGNYVVPDAVAVLNSKQDLCTYWDDMLCGCAVAWKLACALLVKLKEENVGPVSEKVKTFPEGWEKWMLDLVGISTIADMVPLQKENRALAHFGLKVLRKTKRPGLLHIFAEQRLRKDFLTEDDVAFTIAPRVNAASRMGDPIQAHMMLYERDRESAERYALDLEELNTQRKNEVKDILSTISFDHSAYNRDVVVVGDVSWGPGILGLIAQKIIDETGKPVFVWGQGEDKNEAKGSCRSLGDVHVVELMAHVGHEVFSHFGGHEGAGGFSLPLERIDLLSDALNDAFTHIEKKEIENTAIEADMVLTLEDINEVTYKAVEIMAPFGEGNPKPVFELRAMKPLSVKWFGKKSEHLEVLYPLSSGKTIKAIQFFASKELDEHVKKEHIALVTLEKSYFLGRPELRLRLISIK
jgi:single-stranded-DNA-specific exonuclease